MPTDINLSHKELEDIANKYNTPFYLYDKKSIKTHAKFYMNTFKKYFPNFEQYYAVKALPNPSILKILKKCGMGFDCSSPEEIQIIKFLDMTTLNKNKSTIMYTSNYTSKSDLEWVLQNSENTIINLDSIDCFQNLLDASTDTDIKIPDVICFRYNPDFTNNTDVKSNNFSGDDTKFGMDFENMIKAYKLAKDKGIKNFGIHVMAQSNCIDINKWYDLIDHMFKIIYKIKNLLQIDIKFIDIGGGIGIPYKPEQKEINLEKLVLIIRKRFDYNINKYNIIEPQLMTECGRYITGSFGWLVSRCQSIKNTDKTIFYGLDASMANLMRPGMYNAYHHITIPRISYIEDLEKANVVGTLCENNDWFCKQRDLPKGIKKGDLFVIHDCGAHAYSMGFNYNSKLHCPEILLTQNGIKQIRKREDIDYHLQNTSMWINHDNTCKFMGLFVIILFIVFLHYCNFV